MKYCVRCNAEVHGLPQNQPHLCADVKRRLARREAQRDAVVVILDAHVTVQTARRLAELIVAKLANMGVEQDV